MAKTKHKSQNIDVCTLDGAKCIKPVVKLLVKHVPMFIRSSQTPNQFFKVLTSLAIQKLSIHSIQLPGSNIPSENSLHHNLKKIDIEQLETVNHLMLAEQVKPFIIPGKKYAFAIDLTDDLYYGEKNGDYVVGGKRKASTNRFFSYATCYLIDGNRKFTIGVIPKKRKC